MVGWLLWFVVSRLFGVYAITEAMLDALDASIAEEFGRVRAMNGQGQDA